MRAPRHARPVSPIFPHLRLLEFRITITTVRIDHRRTFRAVHICTRGNRQHFCTDGRGGNAQWLWCVSKVQWPHLPIKLRHNYRSQIFCRPTGNFLGILDDLVNVSFLHPRLTKPHHTGTCLLTVLTNVKVNNQLGCQCCSVYLRS